MDLAKLVESGLKKWTKHRKAEERTANARDRRSEVMTCSYRETIKDVAEEIMEDAYLKASSGGKLPAHARQIMYAARGEIQRRTSRSLNDQYFTQTLLPDFMSNFPAETATWDVVFDARGHFEEPHTEKVIPLGTISVRDYIAEVSEGCDPEIDVAIADSDRFPTSGPRNRFGAVLFIEKEGFLPLFKAVKLAERYDVAIMSTKGMSVTASRRLVDQLCGSAHVPLFVLHDFDKSGFSILGTLQRDTRRYEFENTIEVIDLGLRLEDVKKYNLESERVFYGKSDPKWNLLENGATKEEVEFLCSREYSYSDRRGYHGQRVELNAFASADLIAWIEGKLKKHGVKKLIPEKETLEAAYRRALEIHLLDEKLEEFREEVQEQVSDAKIPRGLLARVKARLKKDPELSWDRAVRLEVDPDADEDDEEEQEEESTP